MGIHDARYKQLHQQARINLDWSRFVSQQLQLGEVEPRSLRSHRAHYVSDHYRERFGDRHGSFRTDRNAYLLLVCEFQSSPDNRLILRLYHYAFAQLLDGLDDGTFQVTSGLPVPILVALYTGRQAWAPPTLSELLPGPLVQGALFPLFFFDMRHMDARAIPGEGWLPGLFALERQADPAGILAVIRELHGRMDHPELRRAFLRFAAATTAPWSLARAGAAERERAEAIWARIDKLEEFTMLVQEIIAQREQELAEARAEAGAAERVRALEEGRMEGLEEGRMEGLEEGRMEGRMENQMEALQGVASLYLDEATLESCMVALQQRGLAALPQAFQVVEAAQQAEDPAAAVAALLRGTGPTRGRPRG